MIPTNINTLQLKSTDFEEIFSDKLGSDIRNRINDYSFQYRELTFVEYNECIKAAIKTILSDNIEHAGVHRRIKWEQGWGENLELLQKSSHIESIKPKYFDKYSIVRWKQRFIKPLCLDFESNMLAVIEAWLFDKYMKDTKTIYEFGCGTGHNLLRLREFNSEATLWGLDWVESSQKLIVEIANKVNDDRLFGHMFDYFKPDLDFKLERESVVFTVASLEQIGNSHDKFIDYILTNNPKLCIHIEPIAELLDENNLLDYLSMEYFKKRNYLSGFLTRLRQLEEEGRAKIIRAQRTYIGSLFIEGYSVIVWCPQII